MEKESNSIYEWKRYFKTTINSNWKVKIINFICNDNKALYLSSTKLVPNKEHILYNNIQPIYTHTNQYNITQYNTTNKQQTKQTTTKTTKQKKPPTYILRVIERILNFTRGGKKKW